MLYSSFMMQPTFFFIFCYFLGRREQSTLSYIVVWLVSFAIHFVCTIWQQSSCLPTGWKRANSWRRQLSRVIFLSTSGSPTYKGLFYKTIDVEKGHCVSTLNGTTKGSQGILLSRIGWKKKYRETRTKHKTKHGRRQSLKRSGKKKITQKGKAKKENSEEWKETPLFCYDPAVCSRTAVTRTKETITKVASNKRAICDSSSSSRIAHIIRLVDAYINSFHVTP